MAQAGTLVMLFVGASLISVVTRVAVPLFSWIALILLLHASRSMAAVPGQLCLWLSLYAALAIGNRGIVPVSGPVYFGIMAFLATATTLPFVLDRFAAPRVGAAATLVFPLAWVAAEFLRSRFTPSATWGSLAYTQYGNLPLMQVAAVVGIWGISFMIAWFASTFDLAWRSRFEWSAAGMPAATCGIVLAAIVVGGSLRLASAPTNRASIRTAMLNAPVGLLSPREMSRIPEGRLSAEERAQLAGRLTQLHDWFLEGSRREAHAGAQLIVWPEQNLLVFKEDEPAFLARAEQLAADERVYLAMGMGTVHADEPLPFENKLVVIDPEGRTVISYLKSHPVAGWEAGIMRRGDGRLPVVATSHGRIAAAICYDADFPEFMRQAAQGSADVLLVPSNDWRDVKALHSQMAAFRAIETGLPLVRATASGLSTAVDPWGRVLGLTDAFAAGDRTLIAEVPVGGVRTLYARTGDLFAWLCVIGAAVALGAAVAAPRQRSLVLSSGRQLVSGLPARGEAVFESPAPAGRSCG